MGDMTPFNKNMMKEFMRNFLDDDFNIKFDEIIPAYLNQASMRSDIIETDRDYIIEVEAPGFSKDQINITVNNGYITIHAKRKNEINIEKEDYIRKERNYGEYRRSFKLENVREDDIKAEYKNGLLKVVLPKLEKDKDSKRKIDIE